MASILVRMWLMFGTLNWLGQIGQLVRTVVARAKIKHAISPLLTRFTRAWTRLRSQSENVIPESKDKNRFFWLTFLCECVFNYSFTRSQWLSWFCISAVEEGLAFNRFASLGFLAYFSFLKSDSIPQLSWSSGWGVFQTSTLFLPLLVCENSIRARPL